MPEQPPRPPTFGEIYRDRRMLTLALLGLAGGLPNLIATDTIAAWLSAIGRDVKAIGLFALVTLPYTFKFLWAPLLDRFEIPRLGRRRGWLIVFQALLAATLAGIAIAGPNDSASPLLPLAILGTALVFLSASFDIVSGAYLVDIVEKREQGAGAAAYVSGYRVAFVAAGAGVLILAKYLGWRVALISAAALMTALAIATIFAREPRRISPPQSLAEAVVQPVRTFIADYGAGLAIIIAFVLLFRLPDQLATRMTMPLLIKHLHFTTEEVGWIRQALGFAITIAGALAGGAVIARLGMAKSLLLFGILQAISNAGFLLLASMPRDLVWLIVVIGIENFCNGLVSAGFVAFLMSCCDHRYSGTQYALLTSLMAAAGAIAGAVSGYLVGLESRYAWFFGVSIVAGLPGVALIPFLPRRRAADPHLCRECGYDLRGNVTGVCPECGAARA
ncbi:MAG TPA: MFS transporter [Phycisphaerales bacterium]|nr:MFS transporter [Phycisphaerales bacterium]